MKFMRNEGNARVTLWRGVHNKKLEVRNVISFDLETKVKAKMVEKQSEKYMFLTLGSVKFKKFRAVLGLEFL